MKPSFRLKKLDNSFVTGANGQPRLRTFKRKDESCDQEPSPHVRLFRELASNQDIHNLTTWN